MSLNSSLQSRVYVNLCEYCIGFAQSCSYQSLMQIFIISRHSTCFTPGTSSVQVKHAKLGHEQSKASKIRASYRTTPSAPHHHQSIHRRAAGNRESPKQPRQRQGCLRPDYCSTRLASLREASCSNAARLPRTTNPVPKRCSVP
jgi:hypothetical protein